MISIRRVLLALVVVVAAFPMFASNVYASAPPCPDRGLHQFANQWALNNSYALADYLKTYNPTVTSIPYEDTLSHAYMWIDPNDYSATDPFSATTNWIEDGYYKGEGGGNTPRDTSTPAYFRTYNDLSDPASHYHEGDDPSGPAVGSNIQYEVVYAGYDTITQKYKSQYYYDNFWLPESAGSGTNHGREPLQY